jgi:antitoxin YefM
MRTTTVTDLRNNLAAELDRVEQDHAPLIITRGGGKPSAVLISLTDYEALDETAYLLSSPKNARRLMEGIAEFERNGGTERKLVE